MIDLENGGLRELGHPPRAAIETCTEDNDLRVASLANGFVDRE
jgi:hypothetical protein